MPGPDKYISRGVRFPIIADELSDLLGKVLTVVDASITDKVQCKAMKDLIRERFGHTVHDNFWHYCYARDFDPKAAGDYYSTFIIEGELSHQKDAGIENLRPPKGHSMPQVPE